MTEGEGGFSLGFINNKYGLIFTKLFTERKRWQLRRPLHGNCKEVINKAWNGDRWKWYSQRNERDLTNYYPRLYSTQGQLKKKKMSVNTPALTITAAGFLFCLVGMLIWRSGRGNTHPRRDRFELIWNWTKPTSFSDTGKEDVSASNINAASENLGNAELCFLWNPLDAAGRLWMLLKSK